MLNAINIPATFLDDIIQMVNQEAMENLKDINDYSTPIHLNSSSQALVEVSHILICCSLKLLLFCHK